MKGGGFLRWYGNQEYVINYGQNGHELKTWAAPLYGNSGWSRIIKSPDFYFRRAVTWTDLTAGRFSARLSPGGFIFDVKGSSAFPEDIPLVLGLLNSSFANYGLNLINPTVSYQVGDLVRLPVPKTSSGPLRELVGCAVALARTDSAEKETTYDFIVPPAWPDGGGTVMTRHRQLAQVERQIDEEVYRLYEISEADRKAIEAELAEPDQAAEGDDRGDDDGNESDEEVEETGSITREELAERWFSYAVGIALGRFQPGVEGTLGCGRFQPEITAKLRQLSGTDPLMVLEEGHPADLAARVIEILSVIHGDSQTEQIIRDATAAQAALRQSVEDYLLGAFFKEHVKGYRKRPVYWLLQSPDRQFSAYLFHERATDQTLAMLQGRRYLGGRIHTLDNKLQEAKAKEASTSGREKVVWKDKAQEIAEILEDLKAFDQYISMANNFPVEDANGNPKSVRWTPEFDDGVLLNAAPLHQLTPSWKRADAKLDLKKAWNDLENGEYDWAKTAMRYWPRRVLKACQKNKSFAIAHGLA